MTITSDTWILAGAVIAACLVLGFFLSLWRAVANRRALSKSDARIKELEQDIALLEANRQELFTSAHEKDLRLTSMDAEINNLRTRLQERESLITRASETEASLSKNREQLGAELARAQADCRGQSVALEKTEAELQQLRDAFNTLRTEHSALQERLSTTLQAHAQLQTQQQEREDRHKEQLSLLNETRESLKKDFENLANRIFEDKGKSFSATSQASLEAMLKPFREQITGFQSRINEVHSESLKGNTALEKEIQKVLEVGLAMNSQASNLTVALKGDKKTTGGWGEAQLERTLELAGLQAGQHYEAQAPYRDDDGKRRVPDFVVRLPENKSLVIDSKVSLVDYDRAIGAETDEARTGALNAHAQAVRNHIDDLASKDYSNLPGIGSPDFVLMFMPIEPAYIEAMKHNKDLFNYGYQKGVIMVSHTTLMPILRTVANLWMIEQSNQEAKEISSRAGDIYNQVCLVAERLQKLGNTLRAANNHYNDTVTGLAGKQGLHGKVERFAQLSTKANKDMAALETLHDEIESGRLDAAIDSSIEEARLSLIDGPSHLGEKIKPVAAE